MAQEQEDLNRIMGYFLEEAKDNLRIIEQGLLNLGATVQDTELINEIYRAAHSIKGGSAMLGASSVRKTSHKLEDYFQVLKERPPKIGPQLESLLLQVFDGLTELVDNLESSDPENLVHSRNVQICNSLAPLFKSLDQMMKVESNGSQGNREEPTAIFASPVLSSVPSGEKIEHRSSNLPDPEESAKHLVFKSDVPTQLRQMLQGFKQSDTSESRKQLDQLCVSLMQAGENFELSAWVELVKLAQGAIANRDNLYGDLAPIVIRELKKAADLVLEGKPTQIKPGSALLNFQTEQSLTTAQNDPELDTLLRMGTTPTEGFSMESSSRGDRSQNTQPPLDPPRSSTQRIGPEVGLSELNTLADLFEGETSDLELVWETEISSISPDHPSNPEVSEVDDISDFSDFFIDESPQDLPQNGADPLNNNLSKKENYDLERETPEDDLKDLLEIEPSIMSTHPKPIQASDFSNLFSNPEKIQDLDDLLELNLGSSQESKSIAEFDLEESNLELTEDENFELDLDLESPERSEAISSTIDDMFDLEETKKAEELDKNFENLNNLFDGLSELSENLSDMDLDALGESEVLEDLSLEEKESSSSSEELFDLDSPSDGLDMDLDAFGESEVLEDLSLEEKESSSSSEELFDLDSPSDELDMDLDAFGESEGLEDLSLEENESSSSSEELFDLDSPSDELDMDLDALGESEVLEDLSLEEEESSSSSEELFDLDSPSDGLDMDLDALGESEVLEDLSLEEEESSSSSEELFDLDSPSDGLDMDLDALGESEVLEDLSLEEEESSSSSEELFDLDSPSDGLDMDLDALGESEVLEDLSLEEEESSSSSEELFDLDSPSDELDMDLEVNAEDLNSEEESVLLDDSVEVTLQAEEETQEIEEISTPEHQDEFDLMMETKLPSFQAYSPPLDASVDDFFEISASSPSTLSHSQSSVDSDDFFKSPLAKSEEILTDHQNELFNYEEDRNNSDSESGLTSELDDAEVERAELESSNNIDDLDLGESSELEDLGLAEESEESLTGEMSLDLGESLELEDLGLAEESEESLTGEMALDLGESLELEDLGLAEESEESLTGEMALDLGESLELEDLGLAEESEESLTGEMALDLGESLELEDLGLAEESEESLTGEMALDFSFEEDQPLASADLFDWNSELSDEDPSQRTLIQEVDDFELGDGLEIDVLDESLDLVGDGGLNFDEPVIEETSEDLEGLDFSLEMEENEGDDLSTLFSDGQEMLGAEESLGDIDDLNLFGDDLGATDETLESLDFGDDLEPVDSPSTIWQELEFFLGVEENQRESLEIFTQLETFLDEPVTLPSPSLPQEVSHEPMEVPQTTDGEFDDLEDLLADADQALGGPPTANVATARSSKSAKRVEQNMRVPIKQLDNLSNLVGELVVNRNSLEQNQDRLRQCLDNLLYLVQQLSDVGGKMRDLYERSLLEAALLSSRHGNRSAFSSGNGSGDSNQNDGWDHIEMDRFTPFHTLSQETIELIVRVRESSSDIEFIVEETDQVTRQFRQVTTQLQEGLTRTRMVPFAQTADRLPGAVRRIATGLNKQAEIQIEGKDTLIDKMIQEQLFDPMTHLINNAMTHGIETPQERKKFGKNPVGKITVRAFHQGNQTVISVSDDGAGINTARVKSKALEKGLITAKEAESMSRLDVYDLLFHPGFSTKDKADNFAGRGVGMDVVRVALREIRGVITTDSMEGQGTTFTIRLPLTLSISKALSCISNHARIAFPMDGVEDMLDVPKERIYANSEGLNCIKWRDTELPFRPLSELLQYNRTIGRGRVFAGSADDDIISIVILRSAGQYLALQVDQVLGEQEIVIKQLEGPIPKPVGVAGATVLGDGRIMPIADVLELIDLSMGRSRRDSRMWQEVVPPQPEPIDKSEPTVLIVDDSITVRELLSMTFVKSGYRVEQARNGLDAWEKLRAGLPCDMIFCDIEMPKLNGLELLERLQGDEALKQIPMAMLTSRGASKFQQHAASLGAKGYFTKPYLEEALLEAAQRMLKGENLLAAMSQPSAEEAIAES